MGFWGSLLAGCAGPLGQVAKTVIGQGAVALLEVAIDACRELLEQPLSNGEKRRQARRRIEMTARAKGLQLSDAAVNLAIEMAVAKLKEGRA